MADVPELLEQWGFGDLVEVFDGKYNVSIVLLIKSTNMKYCSVNCV
jgi:hypothetical protein